MPVHDLGRSGRLTAPESLPAPAQGGLLEKRLVQLAGNIFLPLTLSKQIFRNEMQKKNWYQATGRARDPSAMGRQEEPKTLIYQDCLARSPPRLYAGLHWTILQLPSNADLRSMRCTVSRPKRLSRSPLVASRKNR